MHIEDNIESGMAPEEARRQAIIQLGGVEPTKEAYRDQREFPILNALSQDISYGLRMVRKNPGFTAVAILTLGLGIGVNTAIFSMAASAVWRPLPLPNSEQLVELWENDPAHAYNLGTSGSEFLDWKENCRGFTELAAIWPTGFNLGDAAEPERIAGAAVSDNFFHLLGVHPIAGRFFLPADGETGRTNLVVLSDHFARRFFGTQRNVPGRTLRLNGTTYEIIGVAPAEVESFSGNTSVWMPLMWTEATRTARGYRTIARLKPGIPLAQTRLEMVAVAARISADSPSVHSHLEIELQPLNERYSNSQTLFRGLLAIVGVILIIACASLAGLLSVRSLYRRHEIGVRGALGASRFRIVRQLLIESLVLSSFGGAAGIFFARWGFDLIFGLMPSNLSVNLGGISELTLDWPVIGYAAVLSLLSGILFGLVPAIQASRHSLSTALQSGRNAGGSYQSRRLSLLFMTTQVAICFTCVSVIGTLLLSVTGFLSANPGFDSENLLTFKITLAGPDLASASQRFALLEQLKEKLKAIPAIQSVAAADSIPFTGARAVPVSIEGAPSHGGRDVRPLVARVSPEYFSTMKEPLLRGRAFTRQDHSQAPAVAIINENLARHLFGTKVDPMGRRIVLRGHPVPYEIIGISGNVHHQMLVKGKALTAKVYLSQLQDCPENALIVVRTGDNERNKVASIRRAVAEAHPDLAIFDVQTMQERIVDDQQMIRYGAACLGLFAALAIIMALIGIHGTLANAIAHRQREFGVRIALGSSVPQLVLLVTRQGMTPVGVGLLIGVLSSLGTHAILRSSLVGIAPPSGLLFFAISVGVAGSMLLACLFTALRVRTANPIEALREE
jgi:putative ABC transport system permease protein